MFSLSTPDFDDYLKELGFTIGERWRRPKLSRSRILFARWLLHMLKITAVPTPEQLAEIRAHEDAQAKETHEYFS